MKIYKYEIRSQVTQLPKDSQILKIAVQYDTLWVWALVPEEPVHPIMEDAIFTYMTGQTVGVNGLFFIDTFLMSEGRFVQHVWIKDASILASNQLTNYSVWKAKY